MLTARSRHCGDASLRPVPIDQIETDGVMAAFRQAARGRGSMERDELLKGVSLISGTCGSGQRLRSRCAAHLRAAIRADH